MRMNERDGNVISHLLADVTRLRLVKLPLFEEDVATGRIGGC